MFDKKNVATTATIYNSMFFAAGNLWLTQCGHTFPFLENASPVDVQSLHTICQAPLPMGFSRQEYGSGLPCPPPGDLPDSGIEPTSLRSPALAGRFFSASATREALFSITVPRITINLAASSNTPLSFHSSADFSAQGLTRPKSKCLSRLWSHLRLRIFYAHKSWLNPVPCCYMTEVLVFFLDSSWGQSQLQQVPVVLATHLSGAER